MKQYLFILTTTVLILSCSDNKKSDEYMLEKDRQELQKSLNVKSVAFYKFFKVMIRSSVETDSVSPEFVKFKEDMDRVFLRFIKYDSSIDLSTRDFISIYRSYRKMDGFLKKTDEDIFPTFSEVIHNLSDDTIYFPRIRGEHKLIREAQEHAILSVLTLISKDLGKEITLYECSETETDLLPDSEFKTLIMLFRGFVFWQKDLYYLSEYEISSNIQWIENHQDNNYPLTQNLIRGLNLDSTKSYLVLHAFNHLFRGFDRLMMDRRIDEKRALEDFEVFLKDSRELGFDNEIIWSIETYLYLKKGESEKAVGSLKKLKYSEILTTREKEKIDEAIQYLEKRKSRKVLKGVFDKLFIAKITSGYFLGILRGVEWEQVLEENNVKHSELIMRYLEKYYRVAEDVEKYSSKEGLKESGNELKDKGKDLLKKNWRVRNDSLID